jgi:4-carboxymuconolactone decarboxylase
MIVALFVATAMPAQAEEKLMPKSNARPIPALDDLRFVTPGLEKYRQGPVGDLWKRSELSIRDRSIVTVAALIARNQTIEMPHYLDLALDNGVKPSEISEIITHLAFYSGLSNAMSAVAVAKDVFAHRKIGADQVPADTPPLLPLDEAAETDRAARVGQQFGTVAPGIVQSTLPTLCSATCGCVRPSRHATGASSLSPP